MNLLLLISCTDLYSYDDSAVSFNYKLIEKEQEINKYKQSRLKYLGITTSWEQGIYLEIKPGEPTKIQTLWDEKVPLKVKIVLNEKALEYKKEKTKKPGNFDMQWIDEHFHAAIQQAQIAEIQQMAQQALAPVQPVAPAPAGGPFVLGGNQVINF